MAIVTAAAVLRAMLALALPPLADGEAEGQRSARYGVIAESIAVAAHKLTRAGEWPGTERELAAALVAVSWHESGWHLRIHAGQCRPRECDAVRRYGAVRHRAASIWQLHETWMLPRAEWRMILGTGIGATSRAAHAAADVLALGRRRCRSDAGMIALYATGRTCRWSGAAARVRTMRRVSASMGGAT